MLLCKIDLTLIAMLGVPLATRRCSVRSTESGNALDNAVEVPRATLSPSKMVRSQALVQLLLTKRR
jgi:hypothetical protein